MCARVILNTRYRQLLEPFFVNQQNYQTILNVSARANIKRGQNCIGNYNFLMSNNWIIFYF